MEYFSGNFYLRLMTSLLFILLLSMFSTSFAQSRWSDDLSEFDEEIYFIDGIAHHVEDEEFVAITDLRASSYGRFFNLQEYTMAIFTAEFDVKIGGGGGADGMVFGWVHEYDYEPTNGGSLCFLNSEGFGIEFDGYTNGNYNDPNNQHIALLRDNVQNHLEVYNAEQGEIECNEWRHVRVTNLLGHVQVFWNDELIIEEF